MNRQWPGPTIINRKTIAYVQNNLWIYFLVFLFLVPKKGTSQEQDVNNIQISFKSAARRTYLDTIKSQTGYNFLYSSALKPDTVVGFKPGAYTIRDILDSIFQDTKVNFLFRDSLILLAPQIEHISNDSIKISKIYGKIVDRNGKPVPFATVYFKESSRGTIANLSGEFKLITDTSPDTLVVSCLGYKSVEIEPENYLHPHQLSVELRPLPFALKGIIIRPDDPEEIIKNSFNKRSKNYTTMPLLMTAFFRESSKQDDEYISLTEAIVEISKSSYVSPAEDLIHLVRGRNGTNIKVSELVNLKVEGGLYNGLRLDVAKYKSYFYNDDALQYCNYKSSKTISFNNRHTYVILFDMKPGLQMAGYRGKLYIDAESLALVRAEFEISPEGIKYAKNILVRKTPRGYKAVPVYAKYVVEYRFYKEKWNMYYARNELKVRVKKERGRENKGYSCDFISSSEFVITDIIEGKEKKIRYRDAASPSDALVEQVKSSGSMYWDDYNAIIPEEPLLKTIKRLQEEGALKYDEVQF